MKKMTTKQKNVYSQLGLKWIGLFSTIFFQSYTNKLQASMMYFVTGFSVTPYSLVVENDVNHTNTFPVF